jgi:cyclic pyranopterin phosphate synthase
MSEKLTHIDADGRPRMVDVGDKPHTDRVAVAEARITMSTLARDAISGGQVAKGDVLRIAELAGVQGCKRTSDLIPLCHPLPIDGVEVIATVEEDGVHIQATVRAHWKTGVEMEALAAVTAAALTVYDCTKAIDKAMVICGVRLLSKRGGRSGDFQAPKG